MPETQSAIYNLSVNNGADSIVLGANPRRRAISFYWYSGPACSLNFRAATSATAGFTLPATGTTYMTFTLEEHGRIIQADVHGQGNGGASLITIIELVDL